MDKAAEEWRVLSVLILLIIICILIADVDVNVRWKIAEDYEPPITYDYIQRRCVFHLMLAFG
jgi:uncharacterized integral membrane protein